MELAVHPELKQPLTQLCRDPKTTVVVLSGSGRKVLDEVILSTLLPSLCVTRSTFNFLQLQNFREHDIWLAAENGMFLNPSKGEWMTTMPEQLNMEWVDSVKVLIWSFNSIDCTSPSDIFLHQWSCVFRMFLSTSGKEHLDHISKKGRLHLFGITNMQVLELCLRRLFFFALCLLSLSSYWSSHTIIDVEFGKLQARDMLQHLWTGPISNASVEVVQGSRSVEVRAAGVTKVNFCFYDWVFLVLSWLINFHNDINVSTYFPFNQGAAIDRILGEIVHSKSLTTPIDYVLCVGHFLPKVI